MLGILCLPRPEAMLRTSAVWGAVSKAVSSNSNWPDCRRSGGAHVMMPNVMVVLGSCDALKELNGTGAPAGDVEGQLLQDGGRTFATAVLNRIGHKGALADARLRMNRMHSPDAKQVADIGHHPLVAGFDEPVFVKPLNIFLLGHWPARRSP